MTLALNDLLNSLADRTAGKFEKKPTVVAKNTSFDVAKLPVDKPEWHAIDDVVCVYFDLKSSTNLAKGRRPESTASIYDAGVGGVAKVFQQLDVQFLDIQGDGGFGLFWGDMRFERAISAAISIRTFSRTFTEQLEKKWPDAPSTGFKVGVASGSLMAKRVGLPRHLDLQEPVWAGNPVNYAAKAAQQSTPERMSVTGSVFDSISSNDFIVYSCECGDPSVLWEAITLDKIPDNERYGQSLGSYWCDQHGEEYCNAVLAGKSHRDDIPISEREKKNRISEGTSVTHDALLSRAKERQRVHTLFASLGDGK